MSILIIGGPRRGKTTLGALLAGTHGLRHVCTDAQRLCPMGMGVMGTPNRLEYDEVSGWVRDNWMAQPGLVIEGVHAMRALQKHRERSGGVAPVTRVIYCVQELESRLKPGQRAQTTKIDNQMSESKAWLQPLLEFWTPDGNGGFAEVPRVSLLSHSPAPVQYKKKASRRSYEA